MLYFGLFVIWTIWCGLWLAAGREERGDDELIFDAINGLAILFVFWLWLPLFLIKLNWCGVKGVFLSVLYLIKFIGGLK